MNFVSCTACKWRIKSLNGRLKRETHGQSGRSGPPGTLDVLKGCKASEVQSGAEVNRRLKVEVSSVVSAAAQRRELNSLLFFRRFIPRLWHSTLLSPSSPSFAMRSFATILLALSLPLHAFAAHVVNHAHRHADVALRPRQGSGARMTYYDITTGLCVFLLYPHYPWLIIFLQYSLW